MCVAKATQTMGMKAEKQKSWYMVTFNLSHLLTATALSQLTPSRRLSAPATIANYPP
jgi:hypothetical protein